MDDMSLNVVDLVRRTEKVLERVGGINLRLLRGLEEERLDTVLIEEMDRRDRHDAIVASASTSSSVVLEDTDIDEDDINATISNNLSLDSSSTSTSAYITLSDLTQLLSPNKIIHPTESKLQQSFLDLSSHLIQQHVKEDGVMWNDRMATLPKRYEDQFNALQNGMQEEYNQGKNGNGGNGGTGFQQSNGNGGYMDNVHAHACLAIPTAVEMVGTALTEHYHGGATNNLVDYAMYEHGASVVQELTSASYVPPPRSNDSVLFESSSSSSSSGSRRAEVEYMKQQMFDEQMEAMYYQQREMMKQQQGGSTSTQSMMDTVNEAVEEMNVWDWFTSFKFESLREYLPDDWERVLDTLSNKLGNGKQQHWSDYTPRGALDAIVPDYVYHSLGLSNVASFGKLFGRTVSPETTISAGYSKSGGPKSTRTQGWVAKPMGQCYPLSMRPEDDPALSILGGGMDMMDDEDANAKLLMGPKYTVRLPHPVYIDAVTIEHRSFPLPRGRLEDGHKGGESAPRWVRVVGFPPCSTTDGGYDETTADEQSEECAARGFDFSDPIDLGSFEYQRITVTGREDDYGGGDDEDEEDIGLVVDASKRRRSVQTFAVKGGTWKPTSLLDNNDASLGTGEKVEEDAPIIPEPEEEEPLPFGQCAPPKDEESEPSCGGDPSSATTHSAPRQIVEAVTFIVEENWGNSEYTCLYRVRVHGDPVSK